MRLARTIAIQLLVGTAVLEVCLRVYNPLPWRVRGDRIELPVLHAYHFSHEHPRKLDPVVEYRRNSLGFRGPDPPADFARHLSMVTVGGSTTECLFLADGRTWTDVLARRVGASFPGAWVNNAGLDGQSTFGHLVLLRDVLFDLHPRFLIFLIGANDVGQDRANSFDAHLVPQSGRWTGAVNLAARHLEVVALVQNLGRAARARRQGLGHTEVDLASWPRTIIDEAAIRRTLEDHRTHYLPGFAARVERIVQDSRAHGIEPVLVTQPALFGPAIDPPTGIDLGTLRAHSGAAGSAEWQVWELYNDVTRTIGARDGVLVVDLARALPKDSRYFYDLMHFTNEGAERTGTILAHALVPWLEHRDPARSVPPAARIGPAD